MLTTYNGKELPSAKEVYVAGRISHASMFGPKDLNLSNTGIDAIVSKKWKIFEPYCGISGNLNRARETTDEVDLRNVNILSPRAFVGSKIEYKFLSTAIEYNVHKLQSLNFKIGARF